MTVFRLEGAAPRLRARRRQEEATRLLRGAPLAPEQHSRGMR